MKENKKTRVTGYFSVRAYKKGVPTKEQAIIAEGGQIAFIANIGAVAQAGEPAYIAELRQHGTPYEFTKEDGTKVQKIRVKFKIGKFCEWFGGVKPANADLDGKRFDAVIQYQHREKKSDNPLSPSGLWANAIAFREIRRSAFESDPFENEEEQGVIPAAPSASAGDNLPFGGNDTPLAF